MIVFSCPDCAKELKVKPELAGKKGKCPHCKATVTVPGTAGESQKTLVGNRRTEDARTMAPAMPAEAKTLPPANKPSVADAKTLPPNVKKPTSKLAPKAGPDAKTLLPGAPAAKKGRSSKLGDTVAPEGAALSDTTTELTEFLEPPQGEGEIGRLGKYRIFKVLGAGGMGVVYQAEDSVLKRSVALKVLLPGMSASKAARDRFLREAQSSAALQHDNVVTVYEVNEANNVPYLAMQLLTGEALDERLARETTLPLAEVLRIGRETAEGLAAAHERGMVHRDIKPANLFLQAPKGRVKILDFGLARPSGGESQLTQLGAVVGTPGYLSPEQANGKPVDARGDLFSLGCVLYRLTTGELPFKGEDMLSLLTSLATTEPAPPHRTNPDVPATLSDLVMRLLSKAPDSRPASAREVADALAAIADGSAPEPVPALVEDEAEDAVALPGDAVAEAPRVVVKKEETGTTTRPSARARGDYDDEDDRPRRKSRREKPFPWWVVWTGGGIALFLIVFGVSIYFFLRAKDDGPAVAEDDKPPVVDPVRPRPRDPVNPRDPNPRDPNPRDPNPRDPVIPRDPVPVKVDNSVKPFRTSSLGTNHWLAFSPDNKHFVSAPPNGDKIYFWDVEKQDPDHVVQPVPGGVTQPPRYSSDGKKLIVGIGHGAVVYDTDNKKQPPVLAVLTAQDIRQPRPGVGVNADRLAGVGFGEKDEPLAVFSGHLTGKRVLGLFDVEKKMQRANGLWFLQDAPFLKAALPTPVGQGVIVIDNQATKIWEFDGKGWSSKQCLYVEREPKCWALSADGKTFLTSHHKNEVRVWNARTGEAIKTHIFKDAGEFDGLGFSQDGKLGLCAGHNGKFYVWDVETGDIRVELAGQGFMSAGAVSPDMKIALGSNWGGGNLYWYRIPPKP